MGDLEGEVDDLEVKSIIGFDGAIIHGLKVHPDGVHLVFPLGNKVSILNWDNKKQDFLSGHTNVISSIDVSKSGKYIASGQINHIGFSTFVFIWDFDKRSMLSRHELHKVRIESCKFSQDDCFLISLGGRDDGNVVVWNVAACRLLCGTSACRGSQGDASTLATCNRRGACFMSGGDGNLSIWSIDAVAKSLSGVDVNMTKLKRVIYCIAMDERDETAYCGTSTGDVLKIRLNFHHDAELLIPIKPPIMQGCFAKPSAKGDKVELYKQGVRSLLIFLEGKLLIGAGDGTIELVKLGNSSKLEAKLSKAGLKVPSSPMFRVLKSTHVKGSATSLQIFRETKVLVGTVKCEVFMVDMDTFETELIITCHSSSIYYVAFPYQYSDVFATASRDDVRIWNVETSRELLRIQVHNFSCAAVAFSHDGKSIFTAWNDGIIRAFTPLTGRLMFAILNAHNKGASALAITHHGRLLVTGGCEGQVRLWNISPTKQELAITLKEHNGPISQININQNDDEAVSASSDGSCIIWDLIRQTRKQILFGNTMFMCVQFYPTGVQMLTGGSDRKISYWEVFDGNLVREIEGSISGAINSIDISTDGTLFVTGGNDQIVKLWKYQEGVTTHIGLGHSAVVTAVRFSPDKKFIVSASAAGSIFIWKNPHYKEPTKPVPSKVTKERKTEEKKTEEKKIEETIEDLPSSRNLTPVKNSARSEKEQKVEQEKTCVCPCKKVIEGKN